MKKKLMEPHVCTIYEDKKSGKKRKLWNLSETIYTTYFFQSILSDYCVFNCNIE